MRRERRETGRFPSLPFPLWLRHKIFQKVTANPNERMFPPLRPLRAGRKVWKDFQAGRKEIQAGCKDFQISRKDFQICRKDLQIFRKVFQIHYLYFTKT